MDTDTEAKNVQDVAPETKEETVPTKERVQDDDDGCEEQDKKGTEVAEELGDGDKDVTEEKEAESVTTTVTEEQTMEGTDTDKEEDSTTKQEPEVEEMKPETEESCKEGELVQTADEKIETSTDQQAPQRDQGEMDKGLLEQDEAQMEVKEGGKEEEGEVESTGEGRSTGSDSDGSSFVMMDKEESDSPSHTDSPPEEIEMISAEVGEEERAAAMKEPEEPEHQEECHLLKTEESGETPEPSAVASEPTEDGDDKDGWTYVLGHDRLKKKVLQAGKGFDSRPFSGQVVTISCAGRLSDGTEVDKHESLTFTLGDGDVIQAFDLCVALMEDQERSDIYTVAQYAYGPLGREPDIPKDAAITYEVEILKVEEKQDFDKMPIPERIELGNKKRERGNYLYARNEHGAAINSYTKALRILDESAESQTSSPEELKQLVDTRVKCYNNLAAAQLKVEAWDAAIKSSDEVLKIQPENVKALFRKGKCLAGKEEIQDAIACLKKALELEPETKIIHQELARLSSKHKAEEQSQKELYQKMLGTDKKPFIDPQKDKSSTTWYLGVIGALAVAGISAAVALYRANANL